MCLVCTSKRKKPSGGNYGTREKRRMLGTTWQVERFPAPPLPHSTVFCEAAAYPFMCKSAESLSCLSSQRWKCQTCTRSRGPACCGCVARPVWRRHRPGCCPTPSKTGPEAQLLGCRISRTCLLPVSSAHRPLPTPVS